MAQPKTMEDDVPDERARSTAFLPRLLTAKEVAEQTGLPLARVYEGGREGWLPCARLGRAVRFQVSVLVEFFEAGGTDTE